MLRWNSERGRGAARPLAHLDGQSASDARARALESMRISSLSLRSERESTGEASSHRAAIVSEWMTFLSEWSSRMSAAQRLMRGVNSNGFLCNVRR